ncbi:hypothetical protein ASD11_04865 [Aeromicrobium sp. Root495]|uniref:SRPBCC family protein n=1 Tax=Aeromicrobium sp. Root495 TaxID=1736550 RepID=UPI0006F528AC|nr:SRPBCC family protein [Aeromicrobium sp. Root495]KQY58954.1 hypothetical protein ASD11_04865 [Aeromicrobium sp. Root495]
MPRIARRTFVAAPADRVWALVEDFSQWHPRLSIYEGGPEASPELVVTVVDRDDAAHTLSYSMPEPPFPISDHLASITVTEDRDTSCYVEWSASFESDPGIMHMLEDQLGDDIFSLALDKLATAAQDQWAEVADAQRDGEEAAA